MVVSLCWLTRPHQRSAPAPGASNRHKVRRAYSLRGGHGRRYAAFGPDQKLYVAIGAPCNICEPKGLEGTIIRMNSDGSDVEVVARGVRNSVGFDWHPETGVLFFTDNGADGMGDDIPALPLEPDAD